MIVSDNGGQFEQPPTGTHNAIAYRVIDLGTHENEYQGQKNVKREVMVTWEIDELMKDGRRFSVSAFYNASLNEKANLRKTLESWRGRAFTEEELKGFDLKNVLGKPCLVNLTLSDKGKSKVAGVSPLPKGMPAIQATNVIESFELDNFDQVVFDGLSDFLKGRIASSPEYQQLKNGHVAETPSYSDDELNDSIPF